MRFSGIPSKLCRYVCPRGRGIAGATPWLVGVFLTFIPAYAQVDFEKQVYPIFEKSCFACHAGKQQMGGLRLDNAKAAAKAVHAGDSKTSSLYLRVAGIGDHARMPMGGKPLESSQVKLIQTWIDEGAVWPDSVGVKVVEAQKHWAYIPPVRPAIPPVRNKLWVRNAIDSFVLARLEREGLQPSPEADKPTLLRRLSLDLTGLPPALAEIDAFLADTSPRAYERQVERLLASPHYGERWARPWLDAARYADSDGFEKDKMRTVWFYRDWVINALNRDLPYNQFIIDQLAGDQLPNATQDQIVATGYLRNSMINEEGGIEPEQFRMEAMFDRIDAIGKGILGVTIQCAQCHNHKYDPLTQEEYYRIFAFFNNEDEANVAVYTPQEQGKRESIFRQVRSIESGLKHRTPNWAARMASWEANVRNNQPDWQVLDQLEVDDISNGGQRYLRLKDGSWLAQGYAPTHHKVKFTGKTAVKDIRAFRLELLNDPNLPLNGPGRSIKGTGALTEFEAEAAPASDPTKATRIKFVQASADINVNQRPNDAIFFDRSAKCRVVGPISFAIDGDDETAWTFDAGPVLRNQPRKAVFVAEKPISFEGGTILNIYLRQNHGGWNSDDNQNNNLGRMRLSITSAENAMADPLPQGVRELVTAGPDGRTAEQTQTIFEYWRTEVPEWKTDNDKIAALWQQHPEGSSQLILHSRADMRETHILQRGDFLKPGKLVTPGTPAFLNALPAGAPQSRLTFAQWLVDRKSPTTARAVVNRTWQAYFGTGIVATVEDLGKQSERPSHPELLDWLAVEFMEKGWSRKMLHRLIVTSAAYRQSSRLTPELLERDPANRLLARGPRLRVEGEIVRDIALAASGLLNEKVGGPSVFPPAPGFLFEPPASYGPKNWYENKDAARYRRALYTFRYRSVPYPMLQTFDAPNGDMACVRRSRSNTPLQALTTLNEPLFVEAAEALGKRILREGGASDNQRLRYAFRLCTARGPESDELAALSSFLGRQKKKSPDHPEKAWIATARVLLNLDETITKE